jgi:protoporphyrinogen oxidase
MGARNSVAVVGAGITGLVAALRLAQAGRQVAVFERYPYPGGLVALFDAGGEPLECFYHHLFTTDTDYVALAAEFGLESEIEWLPSRMGMFSRGRLWDFGTPASLLRFRPLSWPAKVRFALTTLWLNRVADWRRYEQVTAREWLLRHGGRQVFDTVWGPLLRQKFAERADDVAMVWLWGKVYLRGRSRSASGLGERLGYMRGSFGRLVTALVERCMAAGVRLELASPVRRMRRAEGGIEIESRHGAERFHTVLFTAAPRELLRVGGDALPAPYRARLADQEDAAALCAVLVLDRPFTPYYWINVADPTVPFGGLMEHTNFISPERYGGRHILYISKYLFEDHPLWRSQDREIWAAYLPHLSRINPAFDESWVTARHVFRAAHAQPIVPCGYSQRVPPFETPLPGLYHACMAQIYPEDRGQNYAVREGNRAAAALIERTADA